MRIATMTTLLGVLGLAACGGGSGSSRSAGPMPQGGSFHGVYNSVQYGMMNICQSGSNIIGDFEKNERHGRIQGTAQGDLLRFEWVEERELVLGRPTITRGRGYFHYQIGEDGDHYLIGEWGIDEDETGGGPWRAVKMRNRNRPQCTDPETAGGEGEGDGMADEPGGWDEDEGDTGGDEGGDEGGDDEGGEDQPPPADDALDGLDDL